MIRAAIFDMDGLLVDSESLWQQSHIEVLARYGHVLNRAEARALAGTRTIDIASHWHEQFNLDMPVADLAEAITVRAHELIADSSQAMPGVESTLRLFATHNVPMAVASSATPDDITLVMNKLGLSHYFAFTYSAVHEPAGKPDPGVFLTTAHRLNVEPADCVVFEDALNGVRAAKAAGMKCIAVPEPANQDKPEFRLADSVLRSLEAVNWPLIERLSPQSK